MSGKNRYLTDPAVVNVYGLLMSELSSLKAQFGLRDLSIVVRDGKYFLEANGRLIEITFINGKIIPSDVWENLQLLLGQLLEQNGFSPVAQLAEQDETVSLFGLELGRDAVEFAGFLTAAGIGKMFVAMGNNSRSLSLNSAYGPVVEGTTIDDNANTVTLDFDRELDTAKLPTTDDFEIFVNGQKADIRGIRINSDKVELELARDLRPNDQVTVRYLDQTGDLENSIQGVDGSLAGSFSQGLVIDGYIAGAQLYIDKDGDGVPDPDEILEGVTTDERGVFLLDGTLNPDNLPILVTGGTNTDTGLPNNTILSAPAGATVITPTTTIIQKMVREGLVSGADDAAKVKAAQSAIKTALGLAEDIDLLSFDPIAALKNQDKFSAGATLHKFNTSVVEILESFGAGTSAKVAKAATEIANQIIEASTKDLELEIDTSFTDAIVDKVFTSGNNEALKVNLGMVVEAIQEATTLDAIATAQKGIAVQIKSEPITNDQTPIVFGTATVGATVTATIAGATYEVVAGPDGKWLVDTSTATPIVGSGALQIVPNGSNDVSVSAKDPSGNTSTAVSQILEIDTTPPAISSASFNFGTVLNITKAMATGTLTVDTIGVEDGQSVTLTLGTKTFLGTVSNNIAKVTVPSGSLQSLQEGVVTYKVDASDAAGNAATQYTDSFSYDGTPPTLTITTPIEGDDIVNAAEDADVLVAGTSNAEDGQTVTVTFKDRSNATVIATATVSNGAWIVSGSQSDISALTNGTITITADVSDAAGNAATQATKTITLDNVAPSAPTLALRADTNNTSDGITSDATVDVTGIEANATWEYSVNNGTSWTIGAGSSFEVPVGTYGDGHIQVRQTDVAGNISTVGVLSGALTIDTTAPLLVSVIAESDSINPYMANVGDTVTLTFVTDGTENGVPSATIIGKTAKVSSTGAPNTYTATYQLVPGDVEGAFKFTIDAVDADGNAMPTVTKVTNPVVEDIQNDASADTITLDFDRNLNPGKLPTPSDFEVLIKNQAATVTSIQITGDKLVLKLSDDLQSGDTVTVEYLDQANDTQNAIQGLDGALAFPFFQGIVIDGYISGAQLYLDNNDDGVPDPNELLQGITTDARGMFLLDASMNPTNAALLIVGGTNIDTGLANSTILSAPEGSTVITPTTTLIQTMVREGMVAGVDKAAKVQAAETAVKTALGIDPTVDLTKFDPIAAFNSPTKGDTAKALHKFNASVIEILECFGAGTSPTVNAAKSEIANQLIASSSQSVLSALDTAFANEIVDAVLLSGSNDSLKTNLSVAIEAIRDAESIQDISTTQKGVAVVSKSKTILEDETIILSGTATIGSTVTVVVAGATYKVESDENGAWTVDTSSLTPISGLINFFANGANEVSITATDTTGNQSYTRKEILNFDTIISKQPDAKLAFATPVEFSTLFYEGVTKFELDALNKNVFYSNVSNSSKAAQTVADTSQGGLIGLALFSENARVATLGHTDLFNLALRGDPASDELASSMFNLISWLSGERRIIGQDDVLHILSTNGAVGTSFLELHANHSVFVESLSDEYQTYALDDPRSADRIRDALTAEGVWKRKYDLVVLRSDATQFEVDLVKEWMEATNGGVLVQYSHNISPRAPVINFVESLGLSVTVGSKLLAGDYSPTRVDTFDPGVVHQQLVGDDSVLGQAADQAIFTQSDIDLPGEILGGTVSWLSSDPTIIGHDGVIQGTGDVVLTATVTLADGTTSEQSLYYTAHDVTPGTGLTWSYYAADSVDLPATDIEGYLDSGVLDETPLYLGVTDTLAWSKSAESVPAELLDPNNSSNMLNSLIAWSGYLQAPASGDFAFKLRADDGAKFFIDVDGVIQSVSAKWWTTQDTAGILNVTGLEAGQSYRIWMFMKPGGTALASGIDNVKLEWQSPGETAWQAIPTSALATLPEGMLPSDSGYPETYLPFDSSSSDGSSLSSTKIMSHASYTTLYGNEEPISANQSINLRDDDMRFDPQNLVFSDATAARAQTLSIKLIGNGNDISVLNRRLPAVASGTELAAAIEQTLNEELADDAAIEVRFANNQLTLTDAGGRSISDFVLGTPTLLSPEIFSGPLVSVTAGTEGVSASTAAISFDLANSDKAVTRISFELHSANLSDRVDLIDIALSDSVTADSLQVAINKAMGNDDVSVSWNSSLGHFEFTDALGRQFIEIALQSSASFDRLISVDLSSIQTDAGLTRATLGVLSGQVRVADANDDRLTFSLLEAPKFGSVVIDAATGTYVYQPAAGFEGYDQFHVQVSDGQGGMSPPIAVSISDMKAPAVSLPTLKTFMAEDPEYVEPEQKHTIGTALPADLVLEDLFVAQTHVLRPDDPYLKLVENRWTLIKLNATSVSGAPAPDFEAVVTDKEGNELGRVRLSGPATLPTTVDLPSSEALATDQGHNNQDSYTAPLKGEWIHPGITISILANGVPIDLPRSYDDADIGSFSPEVGAGMILDVASTNLTLFERSEVQYADSLVSWGAEALAKLPVEGIRLYSYPAVALDSFTTLSNQYVGIFSGEKSGLPGSDPLLTGNGGFNGSIDFAYNFSRQMSRANGMVSNSGLVFNTSLYPNGGGGLGGGGLGGGDPTAGILWHEFAGHGMGLPHAGTDANYPYQSTSSTYTDNVWSVLEDGTVYSADGGIGPNWGYDQVTGEYLPNFYYPNGELKLASDPMWGGAGKQPDGYAFQMFSDYYNLKIYDFIERQIEWRPNAVEGQDTEDGGFAGEGYFELWDSEAQDWVTLTDANYKTLNSKLVEDDLAHVIDTPVYFISGYITQPDGSKPVIGGEYHPGIELVPIQTIGNLVAPFADILTGAGRSDREGDYVMRVTYATELGLLTEHLIIPSNYDMRYFGVNIADKGELVRVDIVEAGDANTAAYLQNKVIGSYVNSDALANTVFINDDRFTLGDESIVLPKYWNGSKVTWSTTVEGLVDFETGAVDASKLGPQSAIKAQWVEQGVYKEQSFVLDLPAPEQVFVQLFGTLSSDESLLYGPLDLPDTLGEARVTWSSSDTGVLNNDGLLGESNGQVSLTAEVTYPNGATQSFSKAYQAVPAVSAAGGLNLWIIETLPDEDPDPADDGGYTIADMRNLLDTGILTTKTPIYSEQWSEIWWWRGDDGFGEFGTDFKDNVLVDATSTAFSQPLRETLWVMSGFLKPNETGEHQIGFRVDDAGLMFIEVDGQLISVSTQNQKSWSTALNLEAGKLYPIWYFSKTTSADPDNNAAYWDTIQTLWRTPSNPDADWLVENTIPAENFVPMPLDPSKPYSAGWLPSAVLATVKDFNSNRLVGDEEFFPLEAIENMMLEEIQELYNVNFKGVDFNNDGDIFDDAELFLDKSISAGIADSNKSVATVFIDIDCLSVGDDVELYLDGNLAFSKIISENEYQKNSLSFPLIDFSEFSISENKSISLEIKVKQGENYVHDGIDSTWEYQW